MGSYQWSKQTIRRGWLTTQEAATVLDVSVWTLRRWLRKVDIEARLYTRHWRGINGRLYTRRCWGISPKGLGLLRFWNVYRQTVKAQNFLLRHRHKVRRCNTASNALPRLPEWPSR